MPTNRLLIVGALLVAAAFTLSSTLFTVHQTQQVLITQFGQPIRTITTPGLHAKIPFIQTVIAFDRRLLDYDGPPEEVILGDQRRLIVDSFTRFRIADPLLFFQTVGQFEAGVRGRLNSIVSSALRRVLGSEPLIAVLSAERTRIMSEIRRQVNEEARRFGIIVEDVRIRRADLPDENTQAILARMQSERERVAREARAEGAELAQRIRAAAERERTVLLAEAEARANVLRGQGEQEAIRIFADAFQRDPQFFAFWRTMQAYRDGLAEGGARLVLSPDSDFFRFLRQAPVPSAEAAIPPAPRPATAALPVLPRAEASAPALLAPPATLSAPPAEAAPAER
ncbi:MAG: protease modulator HflC [Acetobacteraceae bacterium]|nr:protease modulator HflC [Acetobacteraceae bacterium]